MARNVKLKVNLQAKETMTLKLIRLKLKAMNLIGMLTPEIAEKTLNKNADKMYKFYIDGKRLKTSFKGKFELQKEDPE